jgi:4-hydroxybenzoate polyprenyltransferase
MQITNLFFLKKVLKINNQKSPIVLYFLTFCSLVFLRSFLEIFSTNISLDLIKNVFGHWFLFYFCLSLVIVLFIYLFCNRRMDFVLKSVFSSFTILLIAPIIDLILSLGRGYIMNYLIVRDFNDLLYKFFYFFSFFKKNNITPGIRIEILIVLFLTFLFFRFEGFTFLKSLLGVFILYIIIFLFLISPTFFNFFLNFSFLNINNLKPEGVKNLRLAINDFLLLLIFIFGIFILFFLNKKYFKEIVKDSRPLRLCHFQLMFLAGFLLSLSQTNFNFQYTIFFNFIFVSVSILFAWLFSVMSNNIIDLEIDKINAKNRPLIRKTISLQDYKKIMFFSLMLSLAYSMVVGFKSFFLVLVFIGNYFLYSSPPLRLKKYFIVSKLIVALNSLILFLLGFSLIGTNLKSVPFIIYPFFLIGYTAVLHVIDVKDYTGDKKYNIQTLPVKVGLDDAKFLIGSYFVLVYLSVFFLINELWSIPLLFLAGIIEFCFINEIPYNEEKVLIFYLFSLILLLFYLFVFKFPIF